MRVQYTHIPSCHLCVRREKERECVFVSIDDEARAGIEDHTCLAIAAAHPNADQHKTQLCVTYSESMIQKQ